MIVEKKNEAATTRRYRSKLERRVAESVEARGCDCEYEPVEIRYTIPARVAGYVPDFRLRNGIIVEVKGRWDAADRRKHEFVRAEHPELDIRFVFSNPWARISKESDTTYADYCDKKGWLYAKGSIPSSWLEEAPGEGGAASRKERC